MPTPFAVFGPGSMYVTRTDIANSTPVNIGYANDLTLDLSFTTKDLYGQDQLPLQSARATTKLTGKAKAAVVSGLAMNTVFFGQTFTTGTEAFDFQEAGTIPGSGPYTVQVTNHATFSKDLGVLYATTLLPLVKVASGPTVGQYSVSAGVYTFAAADTGLNVLISYTNTVSASGQTLSVTNQLIGTTPTFQMDYATSNLGQTLIVRAYACIGAKLAMAFKLEDFMMPEFDFSIYANASGKAFDIFFPQVS